MQQAPARKKTVVRVQRPVQSFDSYDAVGEGGRSRLMQALGWKNSSMNKSAKNFAAAYIDPCHGSHITDCEGIPIAGSQYHLKYSKPFEVPYTVPANHEVIAYLTPYPECPLVIWDNTIRSLRGFSDPSLGQDYFKNSKVYAYRPFGLGVTVYNPNAMLVKQGMIQATRLPPCIDKHSVPLAGGKPSYSRVFEGMPSTYNQVTGTAVRQVMEASRGVYLPDRVIDSSFPFVYRNTEWDKATYTPYSINDQGKVVAGAPIKNTLAFAMPTGNPNGETEIIYVSSDANPAMVSSDNSIAVTGTIGSGMMLGVIAFSPPTEDQQYTFKICHGYELLVKPTSLLNGTYIKPLEPDIYLVNALFTFLAQRDQVAYPASYNFWGKLWEGFKNIYKKIRPALPSVIKYLPGPIGGIANVATEVLDKVV